MDINDPNRLHERVQHLGMPNAFVNGSKAKTTPKVEKPAIPATDSADLDTSSNDDTPEKRRRQREWHTYDRKGQKHHQVPENNGNDLE